MMLWRASLGRTGVAAMMHSAPGISSSNAASSATTTVPRNDVSVNKATRMHFFSHRFLAVLFLIAFIGAGCWTTTGDLSRLRADIVRDLSPPGRSVTSGRLAFDALMTTNSRITAGTFVDLGQDGVPLVSTLSACASPVQPAAGDNSTEPTALLQQALQAALGTTPTIPSFPSAQWPHVGIFSNSIDVRTNLQIPSFSVHGSLSAQGISFQAWRLTSTPTSVVLDDAARARLTVCCAVRGCGQYYVTSAEPMTQYAYSFNNVTVGVNGRYLVSSADVTATSRSVSFQQTSWERLTVVPMPPRAARLEQVCSIPNIISIARSYNAIWNCPIDGLSVVDSENLSATLTPGPAGTISVHIDMAAGPGTIGRFSVGVGTLLHEIRVIRGSDALNQPVVPVVDPRTFSDRFSGSIRLSIQNSRAEPLCFVHLSPVSETSWGSSWLRPGDPIGPTATHEFGVIAGIYDIMVRNCSQHTVLDRRAVSVTSDTTISVTSDAPL